MATSVRNKQSGASFESAAQALSERLNGKRSRSLIAVAPGVAELALVFAIGLAAAILFYKLFAPLPSPERLPSMAAPVAVQSASGEIEHNPFRTAAIEAAAPEPETGADYEETSLDLRLHGVFTLNDTETAFISTPDGKQGNFRAGEEIWRDVTLERVVSSEQIVILASGVRETLTLINRDPKEAANQSTPTSRAARPAQPAPSGGLSIRDIAKISPISSTEGLRLVVQPGPNRRAFDASGLKPGDVIVAVNNRRLGSDLASEVSRFAGLARSGRVNLVVERDGVSVPVSLEFPGGGG